MKSFGLEKCFKSDSHRLTTTQQVRQETLRQESSVKFRKLCALATILFLFSAAPEWVVPMAAHYGPIFCMVPTERQFNISAKGDVPDSTRRSWQYYLKGGTGKIREFAT